MGQTASEGVGTAHRSDDLPPVTFRCCKNRDMPAIMEIDRESFFDPWSAATWQRELNSPIACWIVEETEGAVVGYAGIWIVAGEAQVMRVAVQKAMRNRGLGLALTQALIRKAWDAAVEAVTLEVRESNLAARKVYERCGFVSGGVRPDYYSDTHEGAVIMWLYRSGEV